MRRDFDWELMRSFLMVLSEGSLGKAAQKLGASQPSLGRHVKQLERALGAELFERRGQRLLPTAFALRLAESAQGMQQGAESVRRLLADRSAEAKRSVRISASRMTATHLLPSLLAELAHTDPAPSIELLAEDTLTNLAQREADLAVRLVKPTQPALVARRVGSVHFGLYATRSYLRRRGVPARSAELAVHTMIGGDRSPLILRGARRLGLAIERAACGFRCDDRVVHWAAIRAGIGIGVLPTFLAAREPGLVRVLSELPLTGNGVWLVAQRDVLERTEVRQVYEFLRTGLVELLAAAPA